MRLPIHPENESEAVVISGLNRNDMSLSIDICKVNYFGRGNNKNGILIGKTAYLTNFKLEKRQN